MCNKKYISNFNIMFTQYFLAVRWEAGTRRKLKTAKQPRPRSRKMEHEHGEVAEMPCGSQGWRREKLSFLKLRMEKMSM